MAGEVARSTPSFIERTAAFFRGIPPFVSAVWVELNKVTWPDRAQTIDATWRIIVFVLFIGAIIGVLDLALQAVLVKGLPSILVGR